MFSSLHCSRKVLASPGCGTKPTLARTAPTGGSGLNTEAPWSASSPRLSAGTALLPSPLAFQNHSSRAVQTQALPNIMDFLPASFPYSYLIPAALLCGTGIIGVMAWLDAYFKTEKPALQMADTGFNRAVLSRCPTINQVYRPFPFLTNCHVETIFAAKFRRTPQVTYARECLITNDGGCISLDWQHDEDPSQVSTQCAPGMSGASCMHVT